jgi:hypothetical protein
VNLTTSIALVFALLSAMPAQARQVCGWYAIAACTRSQADAGDFAGNGWGAVINTNDYSGFRRGYFCVVSGPQSKSSATRDVRTANANGVAEGMYIKRACTDERNLGD